MRPACSTRSPFRAAGVRTLALAFSLVALTPGCGGGSSSSATPAPTIPAPTSLVYPSNPAIYVLGTSIAVNVPTHGGGAVSAFTVTPALPAGLTLDAVAGQISGTPAALSPVAVYQVRATNAGGAATADLTLTVQDLPPAIDYGGVNLQLWKGETIAPLTPTTSGGAVVSWAISPPPPPGLSFSTATGVLSGTPTAGAPAQVYTVTATNSGGSVTADLGLAVAGSVPGIASFTATPDVVPQGSATLLTWTLSGDPASDVKLDGVSVFGQSSASVTPRRRQTYTLEASNRFGPSVAVLTVAAQGLEILAGNVDGAGWRDGTGAAARFNHPHGVAADGSGNFYVTDQANQTIRKIAPGGVVTTVAGQAGQRGSADGPGNWAAFSYPEGLAIDPAGNLYVVDRGNSTLRKVTPAGVVTTLAGYAGSQGATDGTGSAARFKGPQGLARAASGDLLVVDTNNQTLRLVSPAGVVTTLAGSPGLTGTADGTGSAARFYYPCGAVAHPDGSFYVADYYSHTIRRVTSAGVVTTLAGLAGTSGTADGTGSTARFFMPRYLAVDAANDLWVSDTSQRLRKVTTAGVVTSVAGVAGSYGWVDGPAASARFQNPLGLAFLPSGSLVIADEFNQAVRVMDMTLGLSTLAGAPLQAGDTDGLGEAARFNSPNSVALDGAGNAFVADYASGAIRKVTPEGLTSTFLAPGSFGGPSGLAMDGAGNLYVVAQTAHTIHKVTPGGVVSTLAGLANTSGSADGSGDVARFYNPGKVALDGAGTLYVTDISNQTVRKITPTGDVTTLAGLAGTSGFADGNGAVARFNLPDGVAVDGGGNVFVGDLNNFKIRKINPAGDVTTLALSTFIYGPAALAFDARGTLWVADGWNHAVFSVETGTGTATVRIGTPGLEGAFPGPFTAGLAYPSGLAFTALGDLLVTTANGLMLATAP
jgi:sugar lactone lactonase YvrE